MSKDERKRRRKVRVARMLMFLAVVAMVVAVTHAAQGDFGRAVVTGVSFLVLWLAACSNTLGWRIRGPVLRLRLGRPW